MVEGEDRTGAPLPADDDGDCDLAIYWTYLSDNIYIYMYPNLLLLHSIKKILFVKNMLLCTWNTISRGESPLGSMTDAERLAIEQGPWEAFSFVYKILDHTNRNMSY